MKPKALAIAALTILLTAPTTRALVNPLLQPIHLYERYKVVLSVTVVSADLGNEDEGFGEGAVRERRSHKDGANDKRKQ